jgi:hypothetical protein
LSTTAHGNEEPYREDAINAHAAKVNVFSAMDFLLTADCDRKPYYEHEINAHAAEVHVFGAMNFHLLYSPTIRKQIEQVYGARETYSLQELFPEASRRTLAEARRGDGRPDGLGGDRAAG